MMPTYNPDPIDVSACCEQCQPSSSSSSSEPVSSSSSSSSSSSEYAPLGSCGFRFTATVDCEADPPAWTVNPVPVIACLVPGVIYNTWMSDSEGQNLDSSEDDSCTKYYFISTEGTCDELDECPEWEEWANSSSEAIVPEPPDTDVPEDCCPDCCDAGVGNEPKCFYEEGSTVITSFELISETREYYTNADCSGTPDAYDAVRIVFESETPISMPNCGYFYATSDNSNPESDTHESGAIKFYTRDNPGDPWTLDTSGSFRIIEVNSPNNQVGPGDYTTGWRIQAVGGQFGNVYPGKIWRTELDGMTCCAGGVYENSICDGDPAPFCYDETTFEDCNPGDPGCICEYFTTKTDIYVNIQMEGNRCADDVCGDSSSSEPEVEF